MANTKQPKKPKENYFSIPQDPFALFTKSLEHLRFLIRWVGMDIFRVPYKPDIFFYKSVFFICVYVVAQINAVDYYWYSDRIIAMHSTATLGVPLQALSKYVATFYYEETFRLNMDTLMEQHRLATGIYQKTLDNWNKIIFIISKSLLVMYMGAVLIFLLIPLAFYVFEGKLQLAIEIVLPFVNPTTERGFYVSLIFQVYSLIFACAGISSIDGMFVLYSFQGLALVQTTRMSFQEFGQRLETGNGMPEHPLVLKSQLRQVLQRYILMQNYLGDVATCYSMVSLVHVGGTSLSMALCLFISTVDTWIIAKILVICFLYQLTAYMVVGTVLEYKCEQLCDDIYAVPWHRLPIELQKTFIIMLQNAQMPNLMMIGDLAPLNLASELSILKTIYSYYTILVSSLE